MTPSELSAFRKAKKMTQDAFAKWLGCSKHAVISWENGRNSVPEWVVARVLSDRPVLNPTLTLEQFRLAEKAAAQEGLTLEQWIAKIIKASLKLIVVGAMVWRFFS